MMAKAARETEARLAVGRLVPFREEGILFPHGQPCYFPPSRCGNLLAPVVRMVGGVRVGEVRVGEETEVVALECPNADERP